MKRCSAFLASCVLSQLPPGAAWSQGAEDDAIGQEEALSAARACNSIEDDSERLACLDAALGRNAPIETEAPVEPDPPRVPSVPADELNREPDQAAQTVRIVEISRNGLGVATFIADDGARWVQTDAAQGRYPSPPFEAVLLPAMRDSFFLVSPLGGPRVRVSDAR